MVHLGAVTHRKDRVDIVHLVLDLVLENTKKLVEKY